MLLFVLRLQIKVFAIHINAGYFLYPSILSPHPAIKYSNLCMQIAPLKTTILRIRAPSVKCIHRLHSSFTQHRSERQFGNLFSSLFQPVQLLFQACSPNPNYSGRPSFIKSFTQPIFNCRNSNKEQAVAPGSWSKLLWNIKKNPTPIYTSPLQ